MARGIFHGLAIVVFILGCACTAQAAPAADMPMSEWTPPWAKGVVWYQIFPDRFRNGDRSNNPTVQSIKGSWPHDHTSPWQLHPWGSDWYELQPWEKANGKDIWFNIQRRRYGGDLKGIFDRLDYLQDLGITALYLNPVFYAPSLHKYDAVMYHHVDPFFGPDPEGDIRLIATEDPGDPSTWQWTAADRQLLDLVREVHRRGMRIILDGVFNHIGLASPFFQDVIKKGKASKFVDWFTITSWDDPAKGTKFDYEGWFGIRELPEWREDAGGIVAGPRKYIFDITRRWMDPNCDGRTDDGIDGWRLDVAFCVKHPFWKDWSSHVRSINPQAYLTAEIIDTVEANTPYLEGDEFSAVMNYNFAFSCSEYFVDEKSRITTTELDRRLRTLREAYDPCVSYVMQNLLDSHDTDRITSRIVNRDLVSIREWQKYCDTAKGSNPQYNTRKPTADEYRTLKLLVIFQMTYLGAPMVYYGDETGMWGGTDPCCRKPMVWRDMKYRDELFLPDGTKKAAPDKVGFNLELYRHYKKLIRIRNEREALRTGDFTTLLTDDAGRVYAFGRSTGRERVVVILNSGDRERECSVPVSVVGTWRDVLNRNEEFSTSTGTLLLKAPARWGRILLLRKGDS